jgi:superfamily II DNA/RNA helicase
VNFMEELAEKALTDEYFEELFLKAEKIYTLHFFGLEESKELSEKEYIDLLRFADILSHSESANKKNLAYKILSLLYEHYYNNNSFIYFSKAILTKLGNFPAISLLDQRIDTKIKEPLDKVFEKIVKEVYQKDPNSEFIFTDSQYKIFESLKASNHYSFSGPTSLGKSFLIEAFIKYLITEHNSKDNLVILVPTRALINQVSNRLKHEIGFESRYKILSHPTIPFIYESQDYKYIFVFTPERLISYLSEPSNPKIDYLFIDEAQKVVSLNDTRSPLYYHAILQAERKSVKLFFSSPNISNSEVFLQLFEKSTNESLSIKESPVSQNRFFLDVLDKNLKYFSDLGLEIDFRLDNKGDFSFNKWLTELGSNTKNLIYCNTVNDTIEYAMNFSETLPIKENDKLNELILLIKEYIHKDYYLIDCLQKGVAFHFGKLPQRIRERIELLFSEKVIDYVFCTSTLLEGVNLPAKNIFILNNAIGLSKFSDIDFWNLAGRAGRLAKELSGNIICVRLEDKRNRWDKPEKDLEIIRNKSIKKIEPIIIKGHKNFFENIGRSLNSEEFTVKKPSNDQIKIWDHYANISLIHEVRNDESVLKSNFIKKNKRAREILDIAQKANNIPDAILAQSSTIKYRYQNFIYNREDLDEFTLPLEVDYKACSIF